jgi:hypothetical protein
MKKQSSFLNVLLAQTKVWNLYTKQNKYSYILNIKNKSFVT